MTHKKKKQPQFKKTMQKKKAINRGSFNLLHHPLLMKDFLALSKKKKKKKAKKDKQTNKQQKTL